MVDKKSICFGSIFNTLLWSVRFFSVRCVLNVWSFLYLNAELKFLYFFWDFSDFSKGDKNGFLRIFFAFVVLTVFIFLFSFFVFCSPKENSRGLSPSNIDIFLLELYKFWLLLLIVIFVLLSINGNKKF